jgi:alginate O-acetyltransferase complex protein AlgI
MLAIERSTGRPLGRIGTWLAVGAGWVVFRTTSLGHAGAYFAALAGFGAGSVTAGDYLSRDIVLAIMVGLAACFPLGPWLHDRVTNTSRWESWRSSSLAAAEFVAMVLVLAGSCVTLAGGTYQPFLYFRF